MSIKLKFTGVVVHKWAKAPWGVGAAAKRKYTSDHVLVQQEKTLERVFDRLEPLVRGGATIALEHRIVNKKPLDGAAYDVIDITVTQ